MPEAPELGRTRIETPDGAGEEAEAEPGGRVEVEPRYLFILPGGAILDVLSRIRPNGRFNTDRTWHFDVYDRNGRFAAAFSGADIGLPVALSPPDNRSEGVVAGISLMHMDRTFVRGGPRR